MTTRVSRPGDGAQSDGEDATWDANHRLGGINVFYDGDTIYAFANHPTTPRLWKTINQGTNWSNINSVPFNVEFDAVSFAVWRVIIGSNAAGAQMAASLMAPYTGSWFDATGELPAGAGTIPAIVWVV